MRLPVQPSDVEDGGISRTILRSLNDFKSLSPAVETTPLPFVCFNSGGRDRSLVPAGSANSEDIVPAYLRAWQNIGSMGFDYN